MNKYLCWAGVLLFFGNKVIAQNSVSSPQLTELTIGSTLPNLTINNIINYNKSTLNSKDFHGRMLILDFWATWCSPCVAMMPKMDSIQKQFSNEIQILPVTYQSKAEVQRLMSKSARFKTVSLPFVTSDSIFGKLFPHKELPHYVWVNDSGMVIAITGFEQITADTIRMMLNKSKVSLKIKKDVLKNYDRETAVLFQNLGFTETDIKYQSLLTDFKEGLTPRMDIIRDNKGMVRKITMLNSWIKFLFAIAWSDDTRYFNGSKIVLEVADSTKVISHEVGDKFKEWLKDHSWTYELIVPEHLSANVYEIMRNDMLRFFPQYKAAIEKRVRRCLVLERTTAVDKIKSKGGETHISVEPFEAVLVNSKLGFLVSQLNHFLQTLKMPVIDGTGYGESVDLKLETNITNVESLRKALQKYDLDLIEKDYEIEVLVIKDNKQENKSTPPGKKGFK